jgi:hypothetical protein
MIQGKGSKIMLKRELITTVEEEYSRPEQTNHFRNQYFTLIGALATYGTEVKRQVSTSPDPDINPFKFVVARHTFIFPPQAVELTPDIGDGYVGKGPRGETKDNKTADFDPEAVTGYLEVIYNDTPRPLLTMRVEDLKGESEIPTEAREILDSIFPPASQTQ